MQLRQTAGYIDANGNIIRGTGDFSIERQTVGHYQIIFEPQFSNLISVVTTQVYSGGGGTGGNTLDNTVIINVNNQQCYLQTGNSGGSASDRQFCFLAVGQ